MRSIAVRIHGHNRYVTAASLRCIEYIAGDGEGLRGRRRSAEGIGLSGVELESNADVNPAAKVGGVRAP